MKQSLQNINDPFVKSSREIDRLLKEILELATRKGASAAAVTANYARGFSVDVRMGEVDTVSFNEDKGIGVTVYLDNQMGQASSTDTSSESIDRMITAALDIAKVSAADPCFGLADSELMSQEQEDLDLYHPWDISPPEAIQLALACEKQALSYDKRIVNSDGVGFSTHSGCSGYANTNGAYGITLGSQHGMSCAVLAEENGKFQRDYDFSTSRYPEKLHSGAAIADNAAARTIQRLGARKIKTRKAPVIFANRLSAGFMNHFIQAISGANLYRKNSFLLDSLGKRLFPQWMQIYEQPYLSGGLGSTCLDTDGVRTRDNHIIVDGCLEQYVLGTYSARRLGLKTTGNAGGVHNLTVKANDSDLAALLKKMGTGLLVTELMGQGVNGLTGDYSRGACGFWIENGNIAFPVEEITIAGNLKQLFSDLVAVGSDRNPNYATQCGSLLLQEMTIAGE